MKLLVVLGIVGATLVGARPAWAATTISLDPAELPITAVAASQLAGSDCSAAPEQPADVDIWVFRADGAAAIESLTATFTSGTVSTENQAWVGGPAGDELVAVTAQVDGDSATLRLIAACPAHASGTQTPLVAPVPSVAPVSPKPSTPPKATQLRTLPVTGTNVAEIAELGAGMVLTGVLLILFRGRRPKPVVEPDEDDIRRPVLMTRRF